MDDPELAEIRAKRMAQMRSEQKGVCRMFLYCFPVFINYFRTQLKPKNGCGSKMKWRTPCWRKSWIKMLEQDVWTLSNYYNFPLCSDDGLFYFSVSILQAAKPDKARQVESMLISMAQRGQIQGQLGEEQLRSILEQVSNSKSQSTISVSYFNNREI